jgi:hypothetical protein
MSTCNATTLDQLLTIRDANPVEAFVVQHVNTCASCSRELERLREVQSALTAMPILIAPSFAMSPGKQVRTPPRRFGAISLAAAASVIALISIIAFTRNSHRDDDAPDTNTYAAPNHLRQDHPVVRPAIASLVIQSQKLESQLQRLPSRPLVERGSTTTVIDSLQTSIQWVDYQLSDAQTAGLSDREAEQLWEDRIQLMDSLVKVRYAEAQRFAVLQYQ